MIMVEIWRSFRRKKFPKQLMILVRRKLQGLMASVLLSLNIVEVLSTGRLWVYFRSSTPKVFLKKA